MAERDPQLDPWFEADAAAASVTPEGLWEAIESDLDSPGWRDPLVSLSTPVRNGLAALAIGGVCVGLIAVQGIRSDLDAAGWVWFTLASSVLGGAGLWGYLMALHSRGAAPVRGTRILAMLWGLLTVWTVLGPFPGIDGVPAAMHVYCFAITAIAVVVGAVSIAVLERARTPSVWRIAVGTAGAGLVGFVAQSVFCPGVDLVHLILGHAAPGILITAMAAGLAWVAHNR